MYIMIYCVHDCFYVYKMFDMCDFAISYIAGILSDAIHISQNDLFQTVDDPGSLS